MFRIPVQRVNKVALRRRREDDPPHLAITAVKLRFDLLPGRSGFDILVQGRQAPIKLGFLCRRQPYVLGIEAIPKPTNKIDALLRRKPHDVYGRHKEKMTSAETRVQSVPRDGNGGMPDQRRGNADDQSGRGAALQQIVEAAPMPLAEIGQLGDSPFVAAGRGQPETAEDRVMFETISGAAGA